MTRPPADKLLVPIGEDGALVSWAQAETLLALLEAEGKTASWHPNECGCCATVHGRAADYVVGRDGEFDTFAHAEVHRLHERNDT